MLNAYTIKKILPRLLAAAIAINLSYYFVVISIDIVNILGDGIADLLTLPFRTANPPMTNWDPGDVSKLIVGVVAAIAGFKLLKRAFSYRGAEAELSAATDGFGAFLLTIGLTIALIIVAIFIVLTIRLGLMVGLAIASPIAFAAMVLPGTEKWFKKWLQLFMTTLMIYPLVMGMMALGRIMTYIFGNIDGQTVLGLTGVFAVIAQFLPLAFIPFSFKLAGGALAGISSFISGKGIGGVKSFIQGNEKDPYSRLNLQKQKVKDNEIQRRLTGRNRAASLTNRMAGGNNAGRLRRRLGGAVGANLQRSVAGHSIFAEEAARNARLDQEMGDTIKTGNDTEIRALTARRIKMQDGSYQWRTAAGKEVKEADVLAARKRWGNNISAQQRALTYEMSKVGTPEEAAMVAQAFDGTDGNGALVEDWNLNDNEAKGLWTGSAYANQNKRLEWKYMKWDPNANEDPATGIAAGGMTFDSAGFATEVYELRGSYQMSQMGSTSINALRQEHAAALDAHSTALAAGDRPAVEQAAERLRRVESIADTFASRGGMVPDPDNPDRLIPTGSGAGAVNDQITAFVNEVRPRAGESRLGDPATGGTGMIYDVDNRGEVIAPADPGTGTVIDARQRNTARNRPDPKRPNY